MHWFFFLLGLLLNLVQPAFAQPWGKVEIIDFTVDGHPVPPQYQNMFERGIRPTVAEIEACYARRLMERPGLGGDFRLRLWVSARQVIRVTPESSVGDSVLEECTRAAILRFTLPPEAPEGGATVRFAVRFVPQPASSQPAPSLPPPPSTKDGESSSTNNAPVHPPKAQGEKGLTIRIDSIDGPLRSSLLQGSFPAVGLEACTQGWKGVLRLRIRINRAGRISARAERGQMESPGLIRCVVQRLESIRLAPSTGPTIVTATLLYQS
ncbi:MAG: hypothetical protein N2515_05920 [Deltaproteobacteria bacterium]|nr:hypothetical protein [Deltaproteobacteria bacterium]